MRYLTLKISTWFCFINFSNVKALLGMHTQRDAFAGHDVRVNGALLPLFP